MWRGNSLAFAGKGYLVSRYERLAMLVRGEIWFTVDLLVQVKVEDDSLGSGVVR